MIYRAISPEYIVPSQIWIGLGTFIRSTYRLVPRNTYGGDQWAS